MIVTSKITPEDVMRIVILLQETICGFQRAGRNIACPADDAEMVWGETDLGGCCLYCRQRHFAGLCLGDWVVVGCIYKLGEVEH